MIRKLIFLFILFVFFGIFKLQAGQDFPSLKVVPWNGHKAASSLTFDDSDPSHLDVAIPELNKHHMHGTFFLIANHTDRKDEWRKILAQGHEIANHTLDHKHAADLTPGDEEAQVLGARNVLQKEFGIEVYTFAYPYTEISPGLLKQVRATHLLARGGYGQGQADLKPGDEPDWMNLPSHATLTETPPSFYQAWINQDFQDGGWIIWMIHGLENSTGYSPITRKNFDVILDSLQAKDIWVDTFLQVGAYWKAQKIMEKTVPVLSGADQKRSWDIPDPFPSGILLKVSLEGVGKYELLQDGVKLAPNDKGLYEVAFDKKEMTVHLLP